MPGLTTSLLGNALSVWLTALGVAVAVVGLVLFMLRFAIPRLARLAGRTRSDWDDHLV